jgi:hypothetical protein
VARRVSLLTGVQTFDKPKTASDTPQSNHTDMVSGCDRSQTLFGNLPKTQKKLIHRKKFKDKKFFFVSLPLRTQMNLLIKMLNHHFT